MTSYLDHGRPANLCRVTDRPVARAFDWLTLEETYRGRLGTVQIEGLALIGT